MRVSELQVLFSNAGYYIGRLLYDENNTFVAPYSRDSGYFETREEALEAIRFMQKNDESNAYYIV